MASPSTPSVIGSAVASDGPLDVSSTTTAGSNRKLVVAAMCKAFDSADTADLPDACTLDPGGGDEVALTKIDGTLTDYLNGRMGVIYFELLETDFPANGTYTVRISTTGDDFREIAGCVVQIDDAKQITGDASGRVSVNGGNSGSPSVSAQSANEEQVLAFVAHDGSTGLSDDAGQTNLYDETGGTEVFAGAYVTATGTSTSFGWSGGDSAVWQVTSISVAAPGAAPSLTNASADASSSTEVEGSVDTDTGSGTLYWIVDDSSTAPSVAQIQAGNGNDGSAAEASGSQSVSASGAQSIEGTGLSTQTQLWVHYQQDDGTGTSSSVVTSGSITTAYAAPGLSLSLGTNAGEVDYTVTDNTGGTCTDFEIRYGETGTARDGRVSIDTAAGDSLTGTIQVDPEETVDAEAFAVDPTLPLGSGRYSTGSGVQTQGTTDLSDTLAVDSRNDIQATLSWSGGDGSVTARDLYRSTSSMSGDPVANGTKVQSSVGNGTSGTVDDNEDNSTSAPSPDTTYYWATVVATPDGDFVSNEVSVKMGPARPANVTVEVGDAPDSIKGWFEDQTGGSYPHEPRYRKLGAASWTDGAEISAGTEVFDITGLDQPERYEVQVRSKNTAIS